MDCFATPGFGEEFLKTLTPDNITQGDIIMQSLKAKFEGKLFS